MCASYQSLPCNLRFVGVPNGFQPVAGASLFKALSVAFFAASLNDSLILSFAFDVEHVQGDSAAKSSSAVLKVGEVLLSISPLTTSQANLLWSAKVKDVTGRANMQGHKRTKNIAPGCL